jgi:hypothetical protein
MEVNMSGESQGSSTVSRVNTTGMSLNDLYGHTAIAIRFVGAE